MLESGAGTLPPGWAANGSFPALQNILLSYNKLSGSLPNAWFSAAFPSLHFLSLDSNRFNGRAPFKHAWVINTVDCELQWAWSQAAAGSLPTVASFQTLLEIDLSSNQLTGTLPESWAELEAFPALEYLRLGFNQFTGWKESPGMGWGCGQEGALLSSRWPTLPG